MKNLSLDARGLRQASAAVAMIAGSILLAAPMAGASADQTPPAATSGRAQAEANAPEQRADGQATSAAASEQGQQASADRPGSVPPEHSNAGGGAATPDPNNGAAEPESPGASGEHKQTICHRTRSATNPYVVITVDFHAVDGELVEATSDHAERHEGPVFDPETMTNGDAWGDIIPPFTTEDGSFGGQNWTDGQEIFENGCELPARTDTGGEEIEDTDEDEDLTPEVGGEDVTNERPSVDEQPTVEDQPTTDVEGDVVTRDRTPTLGNGVLGIATPATDTEVLGAVVTRTPTAVGGSQIASLPRTGNATGLLAAAGGGLVALGLLLVRGTRRTAAAA